MTTNGIQLLFIETHNWGKTVALFVAEQSLDDPVGMEVYLAAPDADDVSLDAPVDVVRPFTASHWGTQVMTVRDPDGRLFRLEAPSASGGEQ